MNLNEEVEILKGVPIFAKMEPSKLKLLAFTGEWTGERALPETPRVAARRQLTFTQQASPEQQESAS